jgi:hypothetical protein
MGKRLAVIVRRAIGSKVRKPPRSLAALPEQKARA